jgi:hypothetical protein
MRKLHQLKLIQMLNAARPPHTLRVPQGDNLSQILSFPQSFSLLNNQIPPIVGVTSENRQWFLSIIISFYTQTK